MGAPAPFSLVRIAFLPGLGRSRKRCRDCRPRDRRSSPPEFPLLCIRLLLAVQDRNHCIHRSLPFSYRGSLTYSSPPFFYFKHLLFCHLSTQTLELGEPMMCVPCLLHFFYSSPLFWDFLISFLIFSISSCVFIDSVVSTFFLPLAFG